MKGTIFSCQKCGMQSPKWLGRCTDCGAWDSFIEESVGAGRTSGAGAVTAASARPVGEVAGEEAERIPSGMAGMDRLLGGGWVPGSVVLIGGEPGIGKSTLMLQLAALLGSSVSPSLYLSGEESASQVAVRARRLGIEEGVDLAAETILEPIRALLESSGAPFVVLDSIQTVMSGELSSAPGTVSQVRAVTTKITRWAKERGRILVIVGHVTKDGAIAGPRTLEHMVDVVLYFEGDQTHRYRVLRSHKNRYGSTHEIILFEMTRNGLVEETNPASLFITHRDEPPPGTAIASVISGTRPLLLEIQALTVPTPYPAPRRTTVGLDINRLHLLTAVMIRYGLNVGGMDIYANVAGGIPIRDPGADLALVAALVSAFSQRAMPPETVCLGEVGLTGEIRPVHGVDIRLKHAARQGFSRALVPPGSDGTGEGIRVDPVTHIRDLIQMIR